MSARFGPAFALAILFIINTMNFFDRQILGAVAEPVREEFGLSDSQIGGLGTAFILLYAVVGVPLGRLADIGRRTRILSVGVFVWSLLTATSGAARTFYQLFIMRLGVGVGEATCAPAATALIGDLFRAHQRARALSVFMLGLPVGIALSYAVSGTIAYNPNWGWRYAFYVAGIPGILCAIAVLFIKEPPRGAMEEHGVGDRKREGSPYKLVLSIPTMWWLILSGALHNFNMYALGTFLSPLLQRFHGVDIRQAGFIAMFTYGLSGVPGLFLGGTLADWATRRWRNGRLLVGAVAIFFSGPLIYLAFASAPGETGPFVVLLGLGCGLLYVYYSTVYATVQDVVEPSLRGTAMALYFCAMYVFGASLGPVAMGVLSDHYALAAAANEGITGVATQELSAAHRAAGLHAAMGVVPLLCGLLALVLFAGSATVGRDIEKLRAWMDQAKDS